MAENENCIVLARGRERSVARRHPWIFTGAVESAPESSAPGDTVKVVSCDGFVLGWANWSPASRICARMIAFGDVPEPDADFVARLVSSSVARRLSAGFSFESKTTNAFRLVNAENDGLPGIVADWYAGWVVCQFTSAGAEHWKNAVAGALAAAVPGCHGVLERGDASARAREGLPEGEPFAALSGTAPENGEIEIRENGMRFFVDAKGGHKTGFYLDQRDARDAIRRLAAGGRDILNCFAYTGGFGVAASLGGAKSVLQVDISGSALELARRNCEANGVSNSSFEKADVFAFLRKCRDSRRDFDMIVLDPPKFADSKGQAMKAARGYKDINLLAMKLLRPGGILATFSCSGAIDETFFSTILAEAAIDAGRSFSFIGKTGHCADHPVALSFPEGRYLKGCLLMAD